MESELKTYGTQLLLKTADRLAGGITTGHDWPNSDDELTRLQGARLLRECAAELERVRADLKAMEGFADLWYFVSDEAPLEFEKIVAEYSPSRWLTEAHKLRAAKRGA